MKLSISLCSFLVLYCGIFAQAPGGVPQLNTWLRADMGVTVNGANRVTNWADLSPTGENFTPQNPAQRPTLQDGSVHENGTNYNPAIDFYEDGDPDYLNASANAPSSQTWFFHHRREAYTLANVAAGYAYWSGNRYSNMLRIYPDINTLTSGNPDDIARVTNSTIYQQSERNDFNLNYMPAITNYNRNSAYNPNDRLMIGWSGDQQFPDRKWQGDINEVIIYNTSLTPLQLAKVHTYLAVKYGSTLSSDFNGNGTAFETGAVNEGDYVATDNTIIWDADAIDSDYHNTIIGIGRDDAEALYQKQSHTYHDSTRLYISTLQSTNANNTGSFSSDISYVMMGDNREAMHVTAASIAEIPANCLLHSRVAREWKITKTNFSQNFHTDLTLSAAALPNMVDPNDLRILVDNDGDFSNGGTACYHNGDGTGLVISYSNAVITISNWSNSHIPNNSTRFVTIASAFSSTPLPIDLAHFEATCVGDKVQLSWSTAAEVNNDYFSLERSRDGIHYETIAQVDGAGHSSTLLHYSFTDSAPWPGTSYYRLRQTDHDGHSEVFRARAVYCEGNTVITLLPNPATSYLTLRSPYVGEFQIVDHTGKIILQELIEVGANWIDLSEVAPGIYITYLLGDDGYREVNKLVKAR